ncbi:MAG: IPT/TIG domain-containing protein [Hyphomicrobium sp.]
MTQANTEIKCNSIAGIGTNHRLTVSTSDQPSALSDPSVVLSYAPPTITGATSIPSILQLPAAGSRQITIGGTNFGDGTTVPTVAYGPYPATGCSVTSAHVQIKCNNIIGVGTNHIITVSIGGQTSAQTTFVASYLAPSISSVTSSTSLSTSGGTVVTLNGANFGTAAVAGSVVAVYLRQRLLPCSTRRIPAYLLHLLTVDCNVQQLLVLATHYHGQSQLADKRIRLLFCRLLPMSRHP